MKKRKSYKWCPVCDGRGKLRHNRQEGDKYILGFIECYKCHGTGRITVYR